jgi:hypothetical protein
MWPKVIEILFTILIALKASAFFNRMILKVVYRKMVNHRKEHYSNIRNILKGKKIDITH